MLSELRWQVLETTRMWPRRAWDQIRVALRSEHGVEANKKLLNEVLDEVCWTLDGSPFTLKVLDRQRLTDALKRNADRRMQGHSEVWATISCQLDLQLALDIITIRNAAARSRQEGGFLVDAFIEAGKKTTTRILRLSVLLPHRSHSRIKNSLQMEGKAVLKSPNIPLFVRKSSAA